MNLDEGSIAIMDEREMALARRSTHEMMAGYRSLSSAEREKAAVELRQTASFFRELARIIDADLSA